MDNLPEQIPVGRAENLTNKQFSRLTVLYRIADRVAQRPTWLCRCECGTYRSVLAKDLKSGKITSCGCANNKNSHVKDKVGQRFGKLTVLKLLDERQDSRALWECLCDCGRTCVKTTGGLRGNCTCGECFKGKDISGQKFGLLTALEYSYTTKQSKKTVWKCLCDCGNETYVYSADLLSGKTQSCGCDKTSHGERTIKDLLAKANISFIQEKSFSDLYDKDIHCPLRFDFFVDNTYLIEYDGIQHFKATASKGGFDEEHFRATQIRDTIKNEYCKKHNIPLIRIPYTHLKDLCIDDLKLETSKFIWEKE